MMRIAILMLLLVVVCCVQEKDSFPVRHREVEVFSVRPVLPPISEHRLEMSNV